MPAQGVGAGKDAHDERERPARGQVPSRPVGGRGLRLLRAWGAGGGASRSADGAVPAGSRVLLRAQLGAPRRMVPWNEAVPHRAGRLREEARDDREGEAHAAGACHARVGRLVPSDGERAGGTRRRCCRMGGACRVFRLHREDGSRLWRPSAAPNALSSGRRARHVQQTAGGHGARSAQVRSGKRRAPVGRARGEHSAHAAHGGVRAVPRRGWGRRRGAGEPRDGRCGGYRRARLLFDALAAHGPGGGCGREAHRAQARIRQARAPRSVVLRARVHERGRAGERRGHRAAGELLRFVPAPAVLFGLGAAHPVRLSRAAVLSGSRGASGLRAAHTRVHRRRAEDREARDGLVLGRLHRLWARRSSRTCRASPRSRSTASTPIATRR